MTPAYLYKCIGTVLAIGFIFGTSTAFADEKFSKDFDIHQKFKGTFLDGSLKGFKLKGECALSSTGDRELQNVPCTVKIFDPRRKLPLKIKDSQSRVAVVGNGQQLTITMGLTLPSEAKGNFEVPVFYLNSIFDQPIKLGRSDIADFTLLHTIIEADDAPTETISLNFEKIQ